MALASWRPALACRFQRGFSADFDLPSPIDWRPHQPGPAALPRLVVRSRGLTTQAASAHSFAPISLQARPGSALLLDEGPLLSTSSDTDSPFDGGSVPGRIVSDV